MKRFMVILAAGYNQPSRFLIFGLLVYLCFAYIYTLPGFTFDTGAVCGNETCPKGICFPTSLYFSGVSFTTIGYGDIAPYSMLARTFAILEGVLGIFTVSSFVVSLVKKYVD